MDTNSKSVEKDTKGKGIKTKSSKVSPTIKCYKCQEYRHIVANYPSPIRITIIGETPIDNPESDSEKVTCQADMKYMMILILIKKMTMLNSTIFNTHLQLIYLSSGVHFHNQQKMTIEK